MTSPDPNAQSGTGGAPSGDPGNGTGDGTDTGTGTGAPSGAPDAGQQTPPPMVSQAEYDALRNRLSQADQKRAATEAELKQIRDKDLPALEKATRDLAEAQKQAEEAKEALKRTRLENAFITDNKYEWENPRTALKLADLSKVEVDDDGTVRNLTAALDALAKSDPYLLKKKADDGDDGDGGNGKGSTGAPGAGGRQSDTKLDAKKYAARIPALRTRGVGA